MFSPPQARPTRNRPRATSPDPTLFTRYEVATHLQITQDQVRNNERAGVFHPTHPRRRGDTKTTLYTVVDVALAQLAMEIHRFLDLRGIQLARIMETIQDKKHRFQPGTTVVLVLDKNHDLAVLPDYTFLPADLGTRPTQNATLILPLSIPHGLPNDH